MSCFFIQPSVISAAQPIVLDKFTKEKVKHLPTQKPVTKVYSNFMQNGQKFLALGE